MNLLAKITASIAKLSERKDNIAAEIKTLRDQRLTLKAAPVPAVATPATPKSKAAPKAPAKAAAPAKSAVSAKTVKPSANKK